MTVEVYRYEFVVDVVTEDVEAALVMAIMGAESLFGETDVRLQARHFFDPERRACVVNVSTEVGAAFNKLFAGFVARECGKDSFTVRPLRERMEEAA
jgi:hypothetical protein